MRLDPAIYERLAEGDLALVRYVSWRRDGAMIAAVAGSAQAASFGELQPVGDGHAAAIAPDHQVWIATGASTAPTAAPDCIAADVSAAVVGYRIGRSQLDALLRRHAPGAMDANLLAPGFRRIGFATWAIELAILPDRPALVIVPRGHAVNFEALAGYGSADSKDVAA
ncbi:hypothetical protein [Sphingorhabdus contaminans]|uniref:hypothetical protein n=1 Tax=Sphingorhabdus contaminans TaxID=1343899 RepID=UPI003D292CFB